MTQLRRSFLPVLLLIVASLLGGCDIGTREMTDSERSLEPFDRVVFESIGLLEIVRGSDYHLTIEAESNVVKRITSEVRDDALHINIREGLVGLGVLPTRNITYRLTVPDLSAIELTGAGLITVDELDVDTLEIVVAGAGQVRIDRLQAERLVIRHSGVGQCVVTGQASEQTIELTGAGAYDGAELESERAEVRVTGLGGATIWAERALDVQITGAGSVGYYGDPELTEQISGLGRVRRLGDKL